MKEIKLVYIGEHFYRESGSFMSSIYAENGERYDFGSLQKDLKDGNQILIRQATEKELKAYTEKLNSIMTEKLVHSFFGAVS